MILTGPVFFDLSFSHWLQSFQPAWLTIVAKVVTWSSQPEIVAPLAGVVSLWFLFKHQSARERVLLVLLSGNVLTLILKPLFARPRPDNDLVHILIHEGGFSFPSGHAIAAMLTVATVWMIVRKRSWWFHLVLILYVLAIGWSRVYLGVHWVSDIFAGFAVGAVWIGVSHAMMKFPNASTNRRLQFARSRRRR